jgi:hypothetical protein
VSDGGGGGGGGGDDNDDGVINLALLAARGTVVNVSDIYFK